MIGKCKNGKWFDRVGGTGGGSDIYIADPLGFSKINTYTGSWMDGI